jgi:hypothetical protein
LGDIEGIFSKKKNTPAGNTEKPNPKRKKKTLNFIRFLRSCSAFSLPPPASPCTTNPPAAPPLAAGHVQAPRPWRRARRQRRSKATDALQRPRPWRCLLYRRDGRASSQSRRRRRLETAGGTRGGVLPRVQRAACLCGYNTADARPRRRDTADGGGRWRRPHQVQP